MPKDAKGKMRLDNNCSTITLSSEKEQLLVRLLRLLKQQQGEHSMSHLQQALCEVGLQETVNRNERKEVDSDSTDESEGGVVIGERERDQTTDFVRKMIRDDRKLCADERERRRVDKDLIKAERRRIHIE